MNTTGSVVALHENRVTVRVFRSTACEGCHACAEKEACHAEMLLSEKPRVIEIEAENPDSATFGERVSVSSDDRFVLPLSFATFVLPFLLAFALFVATAFALPPEPRVWLALGAFVFFFVLFAFASNRYVKKHVRFIAHKISQESAETPAR